MQDRRARYVSEVRDQDGRVTNVSLTPPPEAVERATVRVTAELEGAMGKVNVDAHELYAEWLLVSSGLDSLGDALVFHRLDEDGIRRRLRDGMFEAFTAKTVSPESIEKFGEAMARVYLDPADIAGMDVSGVEAFFGLRDTSVSKRSSCLEEAIRGYRRTGSEQAYTLPRDAMAQRKFTQVNAARYPRFEMNRAHVRGYAELRPDDAENLSPEQAEAWATVMWERAGQISDLDGDVLDCLCDAWISRADKTADRVTIAIDDILRMRGVQPHLSGARRGGYTPEQRLAVVRSLARIASLWVTITEGTIHVPEKPGGKSSPKLYRHEDRVFSLTSRFGRVRADQTLEVEHVKFRPEGVFADFLGAEKGRRVAYLSTAALRYHAKNETMKKRIAKYLATQWKINDGDTVRLREGQNDGLTVSTLLNAIGVQPGKRPGKVREKIEEALDGLQRDGVIAGWEYRADTFADPTRLSRPAITRKWLSSKILIEAPDVIKEVYAQSKRRKARRAEVSSKYDPPQLEQVDELGQRLKGSRKALGKSQLQMAEEVGISRAVVGRIETGTAQRMGKARAAARRWLDTYENTNRS